MNGIRWKVYIVPPDSHLLVDRTGKLTVAITDSVIRNIYLSSALHGEFKFRVILHELGHCALFSYGLIYDVHKIVDRSNWIEAEEWLCNLIADYGTRIFRVAYRLYGDGAWPIVMNEIDRFIKVA